MRIMVEVKSIENATKKWVKGSIIKAYLGGEKDLSWIIGIIRDANLDKEKLGNILKEIGGYNQDSIRLKELENSCKEGGFV